MQTVFIKGITGQDGSYITEFFLSKGYKVNGLKKRRFNKFLKIFL